MERTRHCLLIIVAFMMCNCLFAQNDQIVRIDQTDMAMQNSAKYAGKQFYYYNVLHYSGNAVYAEPPYPYSNGRVRNGKYKASATALDDYIKTITALSGQKVTFVKFLQYNDNIGAVMAKENGDTLFFQHYIALGELVGANYLDSLKKCDIGKEVYYNSTYVSRKSYSVIMACFLSYKNVKSGELFGFLPAMSKWKVTDVSFGTDYMGNVSPINDGMNTSYLRIKYTIENPQLGKFECYPYVLTYSPLVTIQNEDLYNSINQKCTVWGHVGLSEAETKALTDWANKGYIEAQFTKALLIDGLKVNNPTPEIVNFAKKGYIPAMVVCLEHYSKLNDVDLEPLYQMALKTYKTYGKIPICRDILSNVGDALKFSYDKCETAEQKSARLDEAINAYRKAIECGYVDKNNNVKTCEDRKASLNGK